MVRKAKSATASCALRLQPNPAEAAALEELLRAYQSLADWLDQSISREQSADLVSLHRGWYEAARQKGGLPSQLTTLALKDWAARRRGEATEGVPFDDKLYAARGVDMVSLTTLQGRVLVRCFVAGYFAGGPTSAPARLLHSDQGWELRIGVDDSVLGTQAKEIAMSTEGVMTRIGRVMAGMAHSVVDMAEEANSEAVLMQALREIDGALEEVRAELGKAKSEQMRLDARMKELEDERGTLDGRIETALAKGREDLAEAGIARQIDIEAQSNLLIRVRAEALTEIQKLESTLDAIRASRREAESRLQDLKRTSATAPDGTPMAGRDGAIDRAQAKVEKAMSVASRVTGVPSGPAVEDAAALQDLENMHRDNLIKERLAQLKARRG